MKSIKVILIAMVFALTGCVTGTRNLENLEIPEYASDKNVSGEFYIGQISDQRQFEQKPQDPSTPSVKGKLNSLSKEQLSTLIGRQRNGFGAAMGDVALPEGLTVQDKVRDLLTVGLQSRGYDVVDNEHAANRISVDISKFWAWFSPGFASVSFEANVQCEVDVEQSSGRKTVEVKGYGINKGQVASNANWELAFQRAFQDFLENFDKVLSDNEL